MSVRYQRPELWHNGGMTPWRTGLAWIAPLSLVIGVAAGGACADGPGVGASSTGVGASWSGVGGVGGSTGAVGGQATGTGGVAGVGGGQVSSLDALLDDLATDLEGTMQAQSDGLGWPAPVEGGYLFVSTDPALSELAGDHDEWVGTPMQVETTFAWLVLEVAAGNRYKFTDQITWQADPWSRAYEWDDNGIMSRVVPSGEAHLERFFNVADAQTPARTVRIWRPATVPSHVLYMHDGQNLFNPNAGWGGWQLQSSIPGDLMVVGIDNDGLGRFDEYTHVVDDIGDGLIGGEGDRYADYVQTTVRGLVANHYDEPPVVGTMGSSLGGLIALHIADRYPDDYDFAASLSGTVGWGSIGTGVHNETILERYAGAGVRFPLYLDSGSSGTCLDSDGDGLDDDGATADNYCVTLQMRDALAAVGYVVEIYGGSPPTGANLFYRHEPSHGHNEAAWAERVGWPMQIFAGL